MGAALHLYHVTARTSGRRLACLFLGLCHLLPCGKGLAGDFLPPVLPWNGASQALIAKTNDAWITPSEKNGFTESPNYDETIAYLKKLASSSSLISLREFGRSAQ